MSILEDHPSVSDKHILKMARDANALLLTEDSDFGTWIFAYKVKRVSVIFLRYKSCHVSKITASLLSVLNTYQDRLSHKFIVITVGKIRIRDLL